MSDDKDDGVDAFVDLLNKSVEEEGLLETVKAIASGLGSNKQDDLVERRNVRDAKNDAHFRNKGKL